MILRDAHQSLADAVNKIVRLTPSEVEELVQHGEYKEYKRGEFLTHEGDVENYVYYILEGAVRNYYVHHGEELSLDFFFAGSFTNSFMSFLLRTNSVVSVKVLMETKVFRFHHTHIQKWYEQSLNFNKLGRVIVESLYVRRTRRELSFISQTARQRYDSLFNENPTLVKEIPLKHLATFLGIKPETLSRIRKAESRKQ